MSKYSVRKVWGRFAFVAGGAIAIAASPGASAQSTTTTTTTTTTTPAASDQDQTVKMEQYVVTGSNIPQAAEALAVPVQVIDQVAMQNSGVNFNTLDLLRKVTPNIMGIGAENAQTDSAATFGGAQANIKGLPTLVLIDGLRVANDPAESTGGDQFVNLNLVPLAAIDRVEVLQDGASAVYGSDAVGGVINLILKKDYNGWEVGGHFAEAPGPGRYEERSGYVVGGVSNDKTSITLSFEVAENTPLFENTRPYTNPYYGTYTFPGSLEVYDNISEADNFYVLAPGLNAPPGGGKYTIQQLVSMGVYVPQTAAQQFDTFNLAKGETLLAAMKRYDSMVNIEHHIFDNNLVGYGNVMFAHTNTWSQLNAQPIVPYVEDPWVDVNVFGYPSSPPPAGTTYVPSSAPGNPFSTAFLDQNQAVPESQPGSADGSGEEILARARFVQYPRIYQNDDNLYRVVGGLKGDITDDYHWDLSANIDRYDLDYTNPGLMDTDALNAALQDGQINPFAITQAPGAFDGVVGTAFVNQLSTLNQFDAKVNGTPFTLPGGKLGFAAGFEYVLETLSAVPDINSLPNSTGTTQGWSNATTFQDFSAKRDFDSVYGEISIPVTGASQGIPGLYSVNVDGAVRYDSYSGQVGASTDPQVTLSYSPIDADLKFRASAGKSFIAPQLFSLYGPVSSGSTPLVNYTSVNGVAEAAQFNQTGGSNPALKPTTANTWTAGFVFTPKQVSGFTLSVDYSDIFEKGVVGVAPVDTIIQSVEDAGPASPYAADVHYNSPTGAEVSGTGGISTRSPQQIYVIQNLINLSASRVDSTDIQAEYVIPTASGRFDITSTWTWYDRYLLQIIPSEPYYNYAGTASTEEGTVPKWRTYTTVNWKLNGFEATVGMTYVDSVQDIGAAADDESGFETVSSFTAWDFQVAYDFGHLNANKWLNGLRIDVGINNAFNRMPPEALAAFSGSTNADVGTYDGAIGRMVYVDGRYRF